MLLAIDTSTPQIGLALFNGHKVIAEQNWFSDRMHTVELAPAVVELLQRCGSSIEAVEGIGVAIGPGSFTSLRVGLSFVKGLSFARGIPVVGINSLDILANGVIINTSHPLYCALPAGRGRHARNRYIQNKKGKTLWRAAGEQKIVTAEELARMIDEKCYLCADLSDDERVSISNNPLIELLSPVFSVRRSAVLAYLAHYKLKAGGADDAFDLTPNYLHLANPIPDLK